MKKWRLTYAVEKPKTEADDYGRYSDYQLDNQYIYLDEALTKADVEALFSREKIRPIDEEEAHRFEELQNAVEEGSVPDSAIAVTLNVIARLSHGLSLNREYAVRLFKFWTEANSNKVGLRRDFGEMLSSYR